MTRTELAELLLKHPSFSDCTNEELAQALEALRLGTREAAFEIAQRPVGFPGSLLDTVLALWWTGARMVLGDKAAPTLHPAVMDRKRVSDGDLARAIDAVTRGFGLVLVVYADAMEQRCQPVKTIALPPGVVRP